MKRRGRGFIGKRDVPRPTTSGRAWVPPLLIAPGRPPLPPLSHRPVKSRNLVILPARKAMDMSQSLWALFSAWRCCCCVSEAAAETVSKAAKPVVAALAEAGTSSSKEGRESSSSLSVSPILASLLGLNRIKTRSGPLPQESFFGFRGEKGTAVLGGNNLSRPGVGARAGGGKKK
ncbi:putative serine/threonine protein kinase IRE3 [Glycine soja]|uniref:Putative serine/threonine protein kinase IRE3 n=1 Tax=Glycine soja TaxID=3848 RepID=A0A445M061_GLYSO|nr:putative serine/threonine protein kinase IRE3 [Glycine soja]